MKLRKLRIVIFTLTIITSLVGSTFAAETIEKALKNGKVGGEAKIWYQTNDNDADKHIFDSENSWFDAGLRLGYNTDTYKGFGIGLNFYAVDDLAANENWANRSMMGVPHDETWAWLGEAYLTYKIADTSARIGRQNIKSPLVNSDTWPVFPNNFEAALIKNRDLPDTTLTLGYVGDERWRGSERFDTSPGYGDDVAMLGAVNKTIPNTTLTAYVYDADLYDTVAAYVEAKTKLCMFTLGAQYILIAPDDNPYEENTHAIAAKAGTKLGIADISLSYSYVTDGALPAAKLSDNRTKTPLYTKTISGDGDIACRPDTESVMLSVSVKPIDDLKMTARYAYYSFDDADKYIWRPRDQHVSDGDATAAEFVCKYTGIKNVTLWAALWYSNHEGCGAFNGQGDEDLITFRCWARYMF